MTEKLIAVDKKVSIRCPQTGKNWVSTSIWKHPTVVLESWCNTQEVKRFENFNQFFKYCLENGIRNAEAYSNWRNKPTVRINNATNFSTLFLMERNFKWFEVRVEYIPNPNWSISLLRDELPAEDFVELCKSRGWKIF